MRRPVHRIGLVRRAAQALIGGALVLALWGATARAQGGVPPKLALQVILKVLTYDRTFPTRGSGEFVVLVPHDASQAGEAAAIDGVLGELKDAVLLGRKLRFAQVEVGPHAPLKDAILREHASAVLLLTGSGELLTGSAVEAARALHLYPLSLAPELVEKAAAVGVANHEGRPQILLNLELAKEIGAEFEPSVLRLAKVVKGEH